MSDDPKEGVPNHEHQAVKRGSARLVLIGVIAVAFAGLLLGKTVFSPRPSDRAISTSARSLTSVRNDASSDYEAALTTGKPIYVLFHSLS